MAKIIHTGGPAFPFNHFDLGATEHGMSLRDYFAAKAMHAFLIEVYFSPPDDLRKVAVLAYRQADAMLEVRKS
jgi:hypothetical protein